MTRKECFAAIKAANLQKEVEKVSGRNFTQTSTEVLIQVINSHKGSTPVTKAKREKPKASVAPSKAVATEAKLETKATTTDSPLEAACLAFLGLLKDSGQLESLMDKL